MFDRWEYTVEANTSEEDLVEVECKISPGILTDLTVYAPAGCKGLLRCRVYLGEKPIAPRSSGRHLSGEGFLVTLTDMKEPIKKDIPVLNWELWNIDTTYDHTPWMSAKWLTEEELYERKSYLELADLNTRLSALFGI